MRRITPIVVGMLLVALGSAASAAARGAPDARARYQGKVATVLKVVDGDTVRVRMVGTGERVTVRLLGIDAPAERTDGSAEKCGGPEAALNLRQLTGTSTVATPYFTPVAPKRVRLGLDRTQKVKDANGRVLAYLSTTDEDVDLGLAQLKAGWAQAYQYARRVARSKRYFRAEAVAERAGRGLWANCAPAGTPTSGYAGYVKCNDPDWQAEGPFDVKARRVDCKQAVTVALRFPKRKLDDNAPPTIEGFRCHTRPISVGVSRAICSALDGLQVVRFDYQA